MEHIKGLEAQVEQLQQALMERAPSFKAQSQFRVSSNVSPAHFSKGGDTAHDPPVSAADERDQNYGPNHDIEHVSPHILVDHLSSGPVMNELAPTVDDASRNYAEAYAVARDDLNEIVNRCKETFLQVLGTSDFLKTSSPSPAKDGLETSPTKSH